MAPEEKFALELEMYQLEQDGCSPEQVDGLLVLRELYAKGFFHEVDPERERREFIRWLYQQGRLES